MVSAAAVLASNRKWNTAVPRWPSSVGYRISAAQVLGRNAYSVADQFELLALALNGAIAGQKPRFPLRASGLLGPDGPPPSGSLCPKHHGRLFAMRCVTLTPRIDRLLTPICSPCRH
jgi:hypothetical protein